MKPKRPLGVTVLAVLELLFGVIATALGGIFVAGSQMVASAASLAGLGSVSASTLGTFVEVFGGVLVIGGLAGIVIGWGFWTGKNWARIIAMILNVVGAAGGLLILVIGVGTGLILLLIDVAILWYLLRPSVKAYFRSADSAQEGPTPAPASAP